jgi:hypothetical protein
METHVKIEEVLNVVLYKYKMGQPVKRGLSQFFFGN